MCWFACLPLSVSVPAALASTSVLRSNSLAVATYVSSPVIDAMSASTSFMPPYSPAM